MKHRLLIRKVWEISFRDIQNRIYRHQCNFDPESKSVNYLCCRLMKYMNLKDKSIEIKTNSATYRSFYELRIPITMKFQDKKIMRTSATMRFKEPPLYEDVIKRALTRRSNIYNPIFVSDTLTEAGYRLGDYICPKP